MKPQSFTLDPQEVKRIVEKQQEAKIFTEQVMSLKESILPILECDATLNSFSTVANLVLSSNFELENSIKQGSSLLDDMKSSVSQFQNGEQAVQESHKQTEIKTRIMVS